VIEELTAGAVRRGLVAGGKLTGTYEVDVDDANQLDARIVLVAEGMCASDRATSDNADAEGFFVSRSVH
jgi:hypothetical protein